MTNTARPAAVSRLLQPKRLLGVDLARGIALIGMMSVHIVPSVDPGGSVSVAYRIAAGRASALFAVLAGLSLVLATRAAGVEREVRTGARRGVIARAVFVAGIGLVLGALGSGVAVILVHYAVLFGIGALFLGVTTRALVGTAVGWLLVSPVAGHLLRSRLPPDLPPSPSLLSLSHPNELVVGVLLTGYYPVLQWTAYLLVGMALGRLALHRGRVGLWLLIVGAALAGGAKLLSALLLGPAGGYGELTVPPSSVHAGQNLAAVLQTGMYGTTPTTSWWWLAVSAPHSGSPLDLLHTSGSALAVIGGCLLAAAALRGRWRWVVVPVAAAGSMTLTLYAVHVIGLAVVRAASAGAAPPSRAALLTVNVLLALMVATAWQFTGHRGPLESAAARITAAAGRI